MQRSDVIKKKVQQTNKKNRGISTCIVYVNFFYFILNSCLGKYIVNLRIISMSTCNY